MMLHQGFSCLFSPKVDIGQSTELLFFLALFRIMCSLYVPFHKSTISVNDVEGKYVKRIFGLHNFGIFLRGHLHGRRFDPSSSSSFIQPQPSHPFAVHGNSKILCKMSMSFTLCVYVVRRTVWLLDCLIQIHFVVQFSARHTYIHTPPILIKSNWSNA